MSEPREFGSRREGWRWVATFTASDGIERPLPSGLRYWRRLPAEREAMTARVMWNDGLWAAGQHPLQQEASDAR
jgi:hypothetical protein